MPLPLLLGLGRLFYQQHNFFSDSISPSPSAVNVYLRGSVSRNELRLSHSVGPGIGGVVVEFMRFSRVTNANE